MFEAIAARRASSNFETLVVSPASVMITSARRRSGLRADGLRAEYHCVVERGAHIWARVHTAHRAVQLFEISGKIGELHDIGCE